ncbi:Extensin family protein (modular protein) [Beijerinckiaceae bacterium RH CH11]|nr:Extensin family protein (modular protein) [Beijerinckiaceae bacterium RH AL8]VVB43753.1 Extensin family protein (modular protein) [Beijerinckiaceae bacterium RH CH11]
MLAGGNQRGAMRHLGSVGLIALLGATALAPEGGKAAPLDFLFGGPPLASRPAYRLRRKPAPPLTQTIPLPPPRPHFAGDPAPRAEAPEPPKVDRAAPKSTEPPAEPERATKPVPAERAPAATAKTQEGAPTATPTHDPFVAPGKAQTPVPPASPPTPPAKPEESAKTPAASPPAPPAGPAVPPSPPPRPADLAAPAPAPGAKPEAAAPTAAPSGATLAFTPRSPEDDPQCPARLMSQKVGIEPTTLGQQPDARCTVVEPVHLSDVAMPDGSKVAFPEHPTIACVTADSFSSYVRDMLSPLAKGTFGAPVVAVWTGPGLECRSRDHIFGARLSAHGQGLAIDIARLKLADGRLIEVGTPNTPAEAAFETAARAGACGYFHTVLGPGSDAYHRTHWHFDLEVRGAHGDSKYCK